MLRLPQFEYLAPCSLEEACSLLKEHSGRIKVLAGGTDLLPALKQRLSTLSYIVDLKQIPGLDQIEEGEETVKIGPLTTLSAVESSPTIKKYFPGLSEAAQSVGATQIKNMATIGGNIGLETRCLYFNQPPLWRNSFAACLKLGGKVCHAVKGSEQCRAYFAADTVPMLIALKTKVTLKNSEGERTLDLESFYTHDGKAPNKLKAGDVISEIIIPIPSEKNHNVYKKLRLRRAIDFPLVSVAISVAGDKEFCQDIKIVLGAVGSGPIVAKEAE